MSQIISEKTKEIVRSSAPVLSELGPQITSTMYKNMFSENPKLKDIFNQVGALSKILENFY